MSKITHPTINAMEYTNTVAPIEAVEPVAEVVTPTVDTGVPAEYFKDFV